MGNPYAPKSQNLKTTEVSSKEEPVEVEEVEEEVEEVETDAQDDLEEVVTMSVKDIVEYVGDDKDLAEKILNLELEKGSKSRTTLINALSEVIS